MVSDNGVWAVLGSGGHTTEMLKIVAELPEELRPVAFVMGEGDKPDVVKKKTVRIPRPRQAGYGVFTSIAMFLWSLLVCMWRMRDERVKCLICNGPALSFVVALSAKLVHRIA